MPKGDFNKVYWNHTWEHLFKRAPDCQGRLLTVVESDQRTVKSLFYLNLYLPLVKATEVYEFQI